MSEVVVYSLAFLYLLAGGRPLVFAGLSTGILLGVAWYVGYRNRPE